MRKKNKARIKGDDWVGLRLSPMDSEQDGKPQNSADAAEDEGLRGIFGSSSDEESSPKSEVSQAVTRVRVLDPDEIAATEEAKVDSDDEEEEERAVKPVGPPLVLRAPIIPRPDKSALKLVKMTNFVTVEPAPFDSTQYQKVGGLNVCIPVKTFGVVCDRSL